ncbi:MAG: phosphopantetheine-binding protein [Gammaproteobacteria bacterium]
MESEVARLIVETLNLQDMRAEEIDPDAPLFGEGLGLDSIDALELALAISRNKQPLDAARFAALGPQGPAVARQAGQALRRRQQE